MLTTEQRPPRVFEALPVDSLVGATECAVGPFFCVQEGKLKMCCESKAKNSQAEPCSGSLSWEYISTGKNHQTRVISFDCSGARPSPCFHNLTDLTGSSNLSVRKDRSLLNTPPKNNSPIARGLHSFSFEGPSC